MNFKLVIANQTLICQLFQKLIRNFKINDHNVDHSALSGKTWFRGEMKGTQPQK